MRDWSIAFISSAIGKKKNPFDVAIKATDANGLKVDSVIKVDKIATLQKKIVLGELGGAEKAVSITVDATLKKLLKI